MTCHPFRVRLVILAAIAVFHVLSTVEPRGAEIELDGQIFTIPEGFTLERVAGPPLVDRPIEADFDELARVRPHVSLVPFRHTPILLRRVSDGPF